MFNLGDFRLTTGQTVPNATLSYKTHGSLNAAKDNAILFPHFLGGAPEPLEVWIGEGRPLDPSKYFIILPGQFGNGVSSSPSNTPSPADGGNFPQPTFADDVIAQHRLITEQFGIQELQLILGWSTGALQTYEWAVRFAPMVKRIASIAGAPKPSPWTKLWLHTVLEEPITSDAAYNNGFYTSQESMQDALRRVGRGTALTLPPPGFYSEARETYRQIGFDSVGQFVSGFWEAYWVPQDPNDIVVQVRKALAADPSEGGDLNEALRRITAKTLVVAFPGDPMFGSAESKRDAERIPNARFQEISSDFGHLATFALSDQDRQAVDDALQKLLDE